MMLAVRASALILISAISVRLLGFNRTLVRIESLGSRRTQKAADCTMAIRRARRYGLFRGNCLSQSLALVWLLRRSGHDGTIRIGVKPAGGRMLAHAWVELAGEVIDPAAIAGEYATLLT